MAPHSSTFAWKIPWTEEPGRLQSMGWLESDTTEWLPFHFALSCIGEGNGNPLQCSCLENPRDGGAWWAAVYGVAHSRTRLRRLSSRSFIVSGLTFRSFIHFEFIFVHGFRKCSSFILLQVVDQFSQHHLLKRLSLIHCIVLPPLSKIRCP